MKDFGHRKHIEPVVRIHFRDRIWTPLDRGFRAICVDNVGDTSGSISEKSSQIPWILGQITKSELKNKLTS